MARGDLARGADGIDRRRWIQQAGAAALGLGAAGLSGCAATGRAGARLPAWYEDLERRTFRGFWDLTPAGTGLTPDRWPGQSHCSVAAVGFALSAYALGAERGWVTRADAAERVHRTLHFFLDGPQGPQATGVIGHRGFFYHFLDAKTGLRPESWVELSTVDTALFLLGALHCREGFDGAQGREPEIRALADALYARVDWRWAMGPTPGVAMSWHPERGFGEHAWSGYDESMFVYLLALGSPTHPVPASAWAEFTRTYETKTRWGRLHGQEHLQFGPQFGHQYTQCWVDLRGLQDDYMRRRGIDYFENSRRATLSQRQYAIDNPHRWAGYGADLWGLTACDGPGNFTREVAGRARKFHGYAARGVGSDDWSLDDGTIAPTAAAASLPFAPEVVLPALEAMRTRYGGHVMREHGFVDAFNPSCDFDAPFEQGYRVAGLGWFGRDHIGIDQGPILMMAANHRAEGVWAPMRRAAWLRRGLQAAGFRGGWLG